MKHEDPRGFRRAYLLAGSPKMLSEEGDELMTRSLVSQTKHRSRYTRINQSTNLSKVKIHPVKQNWLSSREWLKDSRFKIRNPVASDFGRGFLEGVALSLTQLLFFRSMLRVAVPMTTWVTQAGLLSCDTANILV